MSAVFAPDYNTYMATFFSMEDLLSYKISRLPRLELAQEIASKSPDAIRASKKLLNKSVLSGLEEGLKLEESLQKTIIRKPNQVEAVMANMEKRSPNFKDPE